MCGSAYGWRETITAFAMVHLSCSQDVHQALSKFLIHARAQELLNIRLLSEGDVGGLMGRWADLGFCVLSRFRPQDSDS